MKTNRSELFISGLTGKPFWKKRVSNRKFASAVRKTMHELICYRAEISHERMLEKDFRPTAK